ncbi:hypothetical protein HY571_00675 [Candidatus Micrarchaeota archaeon]|nr:hypothetical protein [Candidatus Micrarchaeota archaeon]
MSFGDVVLNVLRFAFSWLKDKEIWKFYAVLAGLYFVFNFFSPNAFTSLFSFETTSIILSLLFLLVFLLGFVFIIYFSYKLLYVVLKRKFAKLREFGVKTFVYLVVLQILMALASIFSVYELKWLALLVAGIIFAGAAFVSASNLFVAVPLGIIAALLSFAYFVVMMRNFARLVAATGLFLEGRGLTESLWISWINTSNKALKILAISLISAAISGVIATIQSVASLFATVGDLVWSFLNLPIQPLSAIIAGVFMPAGVIISTFIYVGLYEWLRSSMQAKKNKRL